jgi:hypothetical protein
MVTRYTPDGSRPYRTTDGEFVKYDDYEELLLASAHHDWLCGCGHWNGPALATCAVCRLSPGNNE